MQRFDGESSLVFEETVVKAPRHHEVPWEHRVGRADKHWKAVRADTLPNSGVETLCTKAMREVVRNAHTLSKEMLEDLPTTIVTRIWNEIRRERKESVHIFRLFASSGHGDRTLTHTTTLSEGALRKPLVDYFNYFSSLSFAWMTDLTVTNTLCTSGDLKQLRNVVNLRRLTIQTFHKDKVYSFDDGVLRFWALCAQTHHEFSFLELLNVSSAPGITSQIFKHLQHFPALQTVVLSKTAIRRRDANFARSCGWSAELNGGGLAALIQAWRLKCAYQDPTGLKGFGAVEEIIKSYVANDHPIEGRDENRPTLAVNFTAAKRERTKKMDEDDFHKLLCFERDCSLPAFTVDQNTAPSIANRDPPSASKRLKIKDGKAVQLGSFLDTL